MDEKLKNKKEKRKKNKKIVFSKILFIVIFLVIIIFSISKTNKTHNDSIEAYSSDILEENNITNEITDNNKQEKEINSNTTDWNLILVNKDNPIPEGYTVNTVKIEDRWEVDNRIKEAAEQMLKDARKEGLDPIICSAYRTSQYQKNLFNKKIQEYRKKGYSQEKAKEQASLWVTIPGTSEHEIGLSLDIVGRSYQILDEKQEKTKIQKWLMEHCTEYGFVLRYPTDKKDITKINYEPRHYRYVGVENAKFMKEKEICLEEYIEYLKNFE